MFHFADSSRFLKILQDYFFIHLKSLSISKVLSNVSLYSTRFDGFGFTIFFKII